MNSGYSNESAAVEAHAVELLVMASAILRRRRLVGTIALSAFLVVVLLAFGAPRRYSASASFLPQTSTDNAGRLAGLAAELGIGAPQSSGESPRFYADYLQSRRLLAAAAVTRYATDAAVGAVQADSTSGGQTLIQLFGIDEGSDAEDLDGAVDELKKVVRVRVNRETGVVTFGVSAPSAELAVAIVARMLELINTFNLESRRSQAGAQRVFVEGRLTEARADLRRTEDALELFLQRNREFRNAPTLLFQHDRLQRDVALRQQVVASLIQSYERARVDEVRDTPLITLVEEPVEPVRPEGRGLVLKGILSLFLGTLVGAIFALAFEYMARGRTLTPDAYAEFRALKMELRDDLVRPFRLFRRRQDG